tara:strand:- start:4317 stop:4478 length:162 start_codon:yes stop_codon:yes gene_type:complete
MEIMVHQVQFQVGVEVVPRPLDLAVLLEMVNHFQISLHQYSLLLIFQQVGQVL